MSKRSSTREQREPTFFSDRDLGKRFVKRLREAGFKVEAYESHFHEKTEDTVWLAYIGRRKWIGLTKDKSIGRDQREIDCFMENGVRAFVPAGKMGPQEFAERLIQGKNKLYQFIQGGRRKAPYFAKVSRHERNPDNKPPKIHIWIDKARWRKIKSKRK